MSEIERTAGGVVVRTRTDVVRVRGWGIDTIRVEANPTGDFRPVTDALVATSPTPVEVHDLGDGIHVVNGAVTAVVEAASGRVTIRCNRTGRDLVAEPWFDPRELPWYPHRRFRSVDDGSSDAWGVEATFVAQEGERIYGLGQHPVRSLDRTGSVIDLLQRNGETSIPAVVSSVGYGMFWNSPSIGRVEFATNRTRWVAERAAQLDYFVYAGSTPAEILRRYCDLTGYAPRMPSWATGLWQQNSFYRNQDELLAAARGYWDRGLDISAMFVDYMHWTHLGNYDWYEGDWPDPAGMAAELRRHDVRTMAAVWPHVSPLSDHFESLRQRGLLVASGDGTPAVFRFADRARPEGVDLALLDLSQPEARAWFWAQVAEHHHAIGVDTYWLDACEPELTGDGMNPHESNARFSAGHGTTWSSMFPLWDVRAVREGLDAAGDDDAVLLVRSAWAGTQRYGAAMWPGDVPSTWEGLRLQVSAGLSMMTSGIPWWSTDIGGFFLGDPDSDDFRELLVRWFEFALCWPLLRLHGNRRADFYEAGIFSAGGPNEIWSFGPEVEHHLTALLHARTALRPYLHRQLDLCATAGTPPVRPMWFEFPDDPAAVAADDQFVLGGDLLVAPVLEPGATTREVYLPMGDEWRHVWSEATYPGGSRAVVAAPLGRPPIFERVGADVGVGANSIAQRLTSG